MSPARPLGRLAAAARLPRSWSRAGVSRAALITVVAAALTVAAGTIDDTVELARPNERTGVPQASEMLVESAALVCPGQQRVGVPGMRDVPGAVQVAASGAPLDALTGLGAEAAPSGAVSLVEPDGRVQASVARRFESVSAQATGVGFMLATGEGSLAPGLAAAQSWWHTGDDDRGLAVTACQEPESDVWLLGGGAGPSRTERVVVVNPGANAVSVRVEVYGAEGPVPDSDRAALSVPPRSRVSLSLDALAPDELRPAVHVVATGGVVTAVLNDAWIDGATARGVEDATGSAAPARDLLVPAVDAAPGAPEATVLRILNPGAVEALVRATVLTADGARQPAELRAVRVGAGATVDVPLTLAGGGAALRLTSDQPVTAAVLVDRRQGGEGVEEALREGDFGWAPALPSIDRMGGVVLPAQVPQGAKRTLHLAAGTAGGDVTVVLGAGQTQRRVTSTLEPLTSIAVPLGDADRVWVSTASRDIRAAVTVELIHQRAPYYSIVPLRSAPTTETSVPVRQVAR